MRWAFLSHRENPAAQALPCVLQRRERALASVVRQLTPAPNARARHSSGIDFWAHSTLHFVRLLALYERIQSVKFVCKEDMESIFTSAGASSGSTHLNNYCVYHSSMILRES